MMIKAYSFVKSKRIRKKISVYKLFLSITLDVTSLFYLVILFGYGLFAFYQVGEIPLFIKQLFNFIGDGLENESYVTILFAGLPIYLLSQSLQRPGVIFSSAEYLLSLLPHGRHRLWLLTLVEKLGKTFSLLAVVGLFLYVTTTVSLSTIIVVALIVQLIISVMTIVQWKLYQQHIVWRVLALIVASLLSSTYILTNFSLVLWLYIAYLIGLFLYALRYLFTGVDWGRVVASSDFLIWNMRFISQATKVKFKKDAQPSLWYRLKSWKEKFPYEKTFAYNRLWYIYGEKQIGVISQVTGAIFLLLTVVSYFKQIYFVILVILAVHMQTTFLVSLFQERLYTGLVNVLPWDMERFRDTFIPWALLISLILLIPTGLYTVVYFDKLFIVYFIYIMALFYYTLWVKLQKYLNDLSGKEFASPMFEGVGYALIIVFGFGAWYPLALLIGFFMFMTMFIKFFREA